MVAERKTPVRGSVCAAYRIGPLWCKRRGPFSFTLYTTRPIVYLVSMIRGARRSDSFLPPEVPASSIASVSGEGGRGSSPRTRPPPALEGGT